MFKVNTCFLLSFKLNQVIPFWKGEKVPIFCQRYFFKWKMWFFCAFGRKTGRAGPILLKLSTKRNQVFLEEALLLCFISFFPFWTPVIWGCCSARGTFYLSDTSCGKKSVASPMKGARWSRVITNCCGCSLSLYLSINLSICSYCNSYHQHESLHTAAASD